MESRIEQITEKAIRLFLKYGIKSLTMDDVARELGISKKTLYQYFEDKNDLVKKVATLNLQQEQCKIQEALKYSANAIEEMLNINRCVREQVKDMHPSILFDLQKYHPEAYEIFKQHKFSYVMQIMLKNLNRGIEEGIYRKDLHPEIVARIYVGRIDLIMDGELFPSDVFSFVDVYMEMIRYHLFGVVNTKGLKLLEKIFV